MAEYRKADVVDRISIELSDSKERELSAWISYSLDSYLVQHGSASCDGVCIQLPESRRSELR